MSFMTSRRPDTFRVWNFIDTVPPETTQSTPGHFRDHGYNATGTGNVTAGGGESLGRAGTPAAPPRGWTNHQRCIVRKAT